MSLVSPTQSSAGDTIEAADINGPINQIAAVVNGNIDADNLASNGVTTAKIADRNVTEAKLTHRPSEYIFDHVASGCVWSGDAYASTRAASMTAGVVYINGGRVTVGAVTSRSFTASKDTYVDVLDASDGTGTLVYTEVTNNAASPSLAANSVRIAIVVTGASNIAAAASINQGQEDRVLPIASSIAYTVTDSLGNLICPRDPKRKTLGYRQIVSNFSTTSTSDTVVTGLSVPFIAVGNRKVKAKAYSYSLLKSGSAGDTVTFKIKESSTQLNESTWNIAGSNYGIGGATCEAFTTPSAGLHTYDAATAQGTAGTIQVSAASTKISFLVVEYA